MKTKILLLCGLCLALPAWAATEADEAAAKGEAHEILTKADAATKAVSSVRFQVSVEATGIAANFAPNAEGEGFMTGWSGGGPEKFYARVKVQRDGEEKPTELEGGGDGESYFLIDHGTKKAYEDMDPLVMGSNAQVLSGLGMAEFVHPTPFDDELGAEVAEIQGIEKIGDEECYKIYVEYSGGRGKSTWFFSKNDYLPRGRIRYFAIPDRGEGEIAIKLSKVEVDPEMKTSWFKLELPEGYEQVDDFAP